MPLGLSRCREPPPAEGFAGAEPRLLAVLRGWPAVDPRVPRAGVPRPFDDGAPPRLFPAPSELRRRSGEGGTAGDPTGRRDEAPPPLTGAGPRSHEYSGDVLLSQGESPQVPSALAGLTSVFGMGTGVTPPLWPPETVLNCGRPPTRGDLPCERSIASTSVNVSKPSAD